MVKARTDEQRKLAENSMQSYMYYPLYNGWLGKTIPIFETTTEAICWQLSRLMKDGVTHSQHHKKELRWVRACGRIDRKHYKAHEQYRITFNAKAEKDYFSGTKFYTIGSNSKSIETKIVMMNEEPFVDCCGSFKLHPDYQTSSGSIFRTKCIRNTNTDDISNIQTNLNYIPQVIHPNSFGMISICSKSLLQNLKLHKDYSINELCTIMKRICDNDKNNKNRIYVSLCCGTTATELNSNEICLCLDMDRRSLFSASINLHQRNKKTIFMSYYDYSNNNLTDLFQQLKETTKKRISVLYQHPSPSPATLNKFSQSCSRVAASLLAGHVAEICMVYDHKSTGTCWNEGTITKAFFNDIGNEDDKALIKSTKMALICSSDSDIVHHPYFGTTNRYGWAKMKKGEEHRIFFKTNLKRKRKRR
ncbi:hypothetical protein FRACYDRAFT_232339 [Fragilariopsis cylindrus CCMP1102]|uniref:Uncharacterized protein n=1 Tax=Fragilariopsis cylindrus CCMP1102 TaxID=635003 RepID=A0A1E7FVP5_9STRA|nr:hypothetical protein FRACYDRAFT_232339 [Fragilariopsis cylindrus CCMP1102]|eukprot:OEU22185.1 hypothetical protein FRACYDRAFT_232339 [Fragilariopsis cylindrus CCMP1102]